MHENGIVNNIHHGDTLQRIAYLALLLLLSCVPSLDDQAFNREKFEDEWWEIQTLGYNICFLVRHDGIVETFDPDYGISISGDWTYHEPGTYVVESQYTNNPKTLTVKERNGCWNITGYSVLVVNACECTLLPNSN